MRFLKRGIDVFGAFLGSIVALPFFAIAALIVKICSPESPILFKQIRVGKRNKQFTIYKLRSMTNERDAEGNLLPDEQRLKTWGKIIRASNLDEAPQVWNILKGEMSWIGPRPLLPHEMDVMNLEEQELRQSVPPGITGWEAVNEGLSENRRQMAELDLYYVRNWSFWFDVKIFFKTAFILLLKMRPGDDVRAPKLKEEDLAIKQTEHKA